MSQERHAWAKDRPRRTMLFVPGDRADMIEKATHFEADSIILDLEDAVLPERKAAARQTISKALEALDFQNKERIVRINGFKTEHAREDLKALSQFKAKPDAVIIPKAELADEIKHVETQLGSVALIPAIETAKGVLEAERIAKSSPNIVALMFGGGDLATDLGAQLTKETLFYARSRLVIVAAAYELQAIDYPYLNVRDLEGLKEDAHHAASLGFAGKAVIHPNQIPIVNEVFTPSAERTEWARKIVEAYQRAGRGAIAVDGELVDLMTVRMAERILKLAQRVKHGH